MIWLWVVLAIAGVTAALAVYVRTAPLDPVLRHVRAYQSGMEKAGSNSYVLRILLEGRNGAEVLMQVHNIALSTPRTKVLAGSVEEGMITYVTRSKLIGYPDFTTVGTFDDLIEGDPGPYLELNARSRFGQSDFGVNRQRVKAWVDALQF